MALYIVDVRPLQGAKLTGVEVYARDFMEEFMKQRGKGDIVIFFANAFRKVVLPKWCRAYGTSGSAQLVQSYFPNVYLNIVYGLFRWFRIDELRCLRPIVTSMHKSGKEVYFVILDPRPSPVSKFVRKILIVHDLSSVRFPHFFSLRSRFFFACVKLSREIREAYKIIAVSGFTRDEIVSLYGNGNVSVRHLRSVCRRKKLTPQVINRLRKKYGLPRGDFLFSLSTLEPRKRINEMIRLFRRGSLDPKAKHLVIAGVKFSQIFKSQKVESSERVHCIGFVDESDKPYLYAMARGFVNVSIYEGYGISVREAFECGLPLYLSDIPPYREIVGKYKKVTWIPV